MSHNPNFGSPEMVAKARESAKRKLEERDQFIATLGGKDDRGFVRLQGVDVPFRYVMLFQKVFAGKGTPMECIKVKCLDCIYDPLSPGDAMQQIRECKAVTCGLHFIRPKTRGNNQKSIITA